MLLAIDKAWFGVSRRRRGTSFGRHCLSLFLLVFKLDSLFLFSISLVFIIHFFLVFLFLLLLRGSCLFDCYSLRTTFFWQLFLLFICAHNLTSVMDRRRIGSVDGGGV